MIGGFSLSKLGAVLALAYAAFAIWVVFTERATPGGGWINLNGMASYLVTLPVSAPMEMLGARPDYQKTFDMTAAILVCAALVYLAGAGLEWLVRLLVSAGRDS